MQKLTIIIAALAIFTSCSKEAATTTDTPSTTTTTDDGARKVAAAATTISFSGYTWQVREQGSSGPGPNYWSASNVWVDSEGHLHLKIRKDPATGRWLCAEVNSLQTFGYGTYVWKIEGAVDKLDKNIVLGLFNYKAGDNGHHEMDIEFARWGNSAWHNYNYTVYPASGSGSVSQTYELGLNGTYTSYKFTRNSTSVSYKGYHGHNLDEANSFFPWTTPAGFNVSTLSLPVHMNLWLFGGNAPSNQQEVEIIIHSFTFTAA